jgi:tRNA(Ile)-lysidine synthase
MSLIDGVWHAIRRYDLLSSGTRVAVAVSGGADSVALLSVLLELAPRGGFSVAGIVHVNHQLRGADSERDQAFCEALAVRLNLPAHVERVDVLRVAAAERLSTEVAARRLRYAALERGRQALGADRVAVGHTRDDQAETVLLRLLRGAGPRGLAGIYPRNGEVVRPLLGVGRQQLRAWSADNGITHVEDASNEDLANPRNLLRHEVLPALRGWLGPSVPEALARAADVARADEELLAELTDVLVRRLVSRDREQVRIQVAGAALAPVALRRRVLLEALRRAGVREPGFAEVEALATMVQDEAAPGVDLPGHVRADRIGQAVVLRDRAPERELVAPFRYALPVPGRVWIAEVSATVQAETGSPDGPLPEGTLDAPVAVVTGARVTGGLFVRNWRPGDDLRPIGLGGTKKLQDLFVDRKVPRVARHRLPLVVDRHDRVVWVPGHALDEVYRASAGGSGVVVLKLTRQWGGSE